MSKIEITDEMIKRAGNVLVLSGKLSGDWYDVVHGALRAAFKDPVFRSGPDTRVKPDRRSNAPPSEAYGRMRYYRKSSDTIVNDFRKARRRVTEIPQSAHIFMASVNVAGITSTQTHPTAEVGENAVRIVEPRRRYERRFLHQTSWMCFRPGCGRSEECPKRRASDSK